MITLYDTKYLLNIKYFLWTHLLNVLPYLKNYPSAIISAFFIYYLIKSISFLIQKFSEFIFLVYL